MNKVDNLIEEFINWYFGKREHWGAHDPVRAREIEKHLTTQLNSLLEEVAVEVEANLSYGRTFLSIEAAALIRSYKSQ